MDQRFIVLGPQCCCSTETTCTARSTTDLLTMYGKCEMTNMSYVVGSEQSHQRGRANNMTIWNSCEQVVEAEKQFCSCASGGAVTAK